MNAPVRPPCRQDRAGSCGQLLQPLNPHILSPPQKQDQERTSQRCSASALCWALLKVPGVRMSRGAANKPAKPRGAAGLPGLDAPASALSALWDSWAQPAGACQLLWLAGLQWLTSQQRRRDSAAQMQAGLLGTEVEQVRGQSAAMLGSLQDAVRQLAAMGSASA